MENTVVEKLFEKSEKIIPAIIQDDDTGKVLFLSSINHEAFKKIKSYGYLHLYRQNENDHYAYQNNNNDFFKVKNMTPDESGDAVLVKGYFVNSHQGLTSFGEPNANKTGFINHLKEIIKSRVQSSEKNLEKPSYTQKLFNKGINKIAQKVGEEAVELVIEAKDNNDELFREEAADLLFHYLLLLEAKQIDLDEIIEVLKKRHYQH